MESSTTSATATNQSPLSLLNNMSNLMSTKLDSTNYMIWKLQISAILDAYSVIDHLDEERQSSSLSAILNLIFTNACYGSRPKHFFKKYGTNLKKGLPALHEPMCFNLKLELQSIKKGNETISSYLQRIKTVRDKLFAVGVHSDHDELLHVILKGLPKEYAPFASAIRTRDGILSLEKLSVLLQTEEQSMQETNDPFSNSALAMFVSHNKPSNGYNANQGYNNHRGRGLLLQRQSLHPQGNQKDLLAKSVGSKDLPTGRLLYKGLSRNGVYPIQSSTLFNFASNKIACTAHSISSHKWQLWHSRLGHPSNKVLTNLFPSLQCNSSVASMHCKHCLAGKMHQLPFPISNKTSTTPFALVHADLWGLAPITSSTGFRFYLVLVDDFTKFTWTYLLKHKSDTYKIFTQFQAMVNTQFSLPIQVIHTDCGERKHRHLIQCALALLSESKLPMSYWSHAVSTATHLINRLPTPNLSHKTPWEMVFHIQLDLTYLKSFGCQCFPLLTPYTAHKLHPKTIPYVFLGYPSHTKGYLCLDPITKRLYTSRHVLFNESIFPGLTHSTDALNQPDIQNISSDTWITTLASFHTCTHTPPIPPLSTESNTVSPTNITLPLPSTCSQPQITLPLSNSPLPSPISSVESPQSQRHVSPQSNSPLLFVPTEPIPTSTTITLLPTSIIPKPQVPSITHPMQTRSKNGIFKPKLGYTAHTDYSLTEPTTYSTASKHPQWCNAMDEEFQALQKQGTWALVPAPSTKNIVGCKWVYKLKYNSDGSYLQLDVKNAFLHGTLKEEVYMVQLQGYIDPSHPSHVTRSSSGLYLNQAKYAHDLLKKHNMLASKPAKSPSCPYTRLSLHEGDPLPDPHGYRSLVGALHYLTFTRPDISFSVHQVHCISLPTLMQTGQETLMIGVPPQAILSTLALIPLPGQPKSNPQSLDHPQSQNTGPLPSPQQNFVGFEHSLKILAFFSPIHQSFGVITFPHLPLPIIQYFMLRTKHIEVDFHFVRERVLRKDLKVKFVSTVDQLADIFTKSLPTQRFIDLQRNLTVSIPVIERGY
uniref:Integrase catalytic domain-containing protein n=1 Tax=Fagus sylvatica TaxID=28930 RepID=A0A2N9H7Q7_FAGSY